MIIVNWKIEFSLDWPIWADSVIESPCPSMCVRHRMQFFFKSSHWPWDHMISSQAFLPPSLPYPLPPPNGPNWPKFECHYVKCIQLTLFGRGSGKRTSCFRLNTREECGILEVPSQKEDSTWGLAKNNSICCLFSVVVLVCLSVYGGQSLRSGSSSDPATKALITWMKIFEYT